MPPSFSLKARDARAARACLLTAVIAGVDVSFEPTGDVGGGAAFSLTVSGGDGKTEAIDQPNAAALAIADASPSPDTREALLGGSADAEAQAQVRDWLSKCHSTLALINDDALKHLNDALLDRTYLVKTSGGTSGSGRPTASLADVVVAAHVADAASSFPEAQIAHFPALARWYDHVAAEIGERSSVRGPKGEPLLPRGRLDRPSLKPPAPLPPPSSSSAGAAAGADKGGAGEKKKKGGTEAAGAAAAVPAAAGAAGAAAAAAAPAAGGGDAAGKKKKEKKEGAAAPAAAAAAAPARPEDAFDLLDVRVGLIVSADKHPDADSLYKEEIDLGEDTGPRTIVSGLANWIPLEDFRGRLVAVVTNLKPAKMRGVVSSGMVLCASTEGQVLPIEPPRASKPGDRVVCEGHEAAAEPGHLNPKKKTFEKVAEHLKTDAEGRCLYKGLPLYVVEGDSGERRGDVTSKVAGGAIR